MIRWVSRRSLVPNRSFIESLRYSYVPSEEVKKSWCREGDFVITPMATSSSHHHLNLGASLIYVGERVEAVEAAAGRHFDGRASNNVDHSDHPGMKGAVIAIASGL
jgi:hypothetical protein